VCGYFSCALEVNELKRTHDALGRALQELATHIENTPLAVVEWSADIRVKRWSPQAEAIFGWKADEVMGKKPSEFRLVHPDSLEHIRGLTRELVEGRSRRNRMLARNITQDGRTIWAQWYNSAFFDENGKLASILSMAEDVTARVDAEEQLRQAAVLDALTGLPNRNSLAARLEHAILRVNRSGDRLALLFIDLDRFKKVNDTLGHAAGDEVLRQAAARIRACVREVDTVARLGGDEFVVLLETDVRPDTPGIIGERIRAGFDSPFDWKGTEVRCGASIGVSLYPDHARDPAALLASADEAMYREKASG
jgi:diguanylate cyclase (GGDEF)-like protein/PAS domain S-box-containing protein